MTAPVRVRYRPPLTLRQRQVLELASHGLTNRLIGVHCGIKTETVDRHLRLAYRRLGARDRAHAVRLCFERHIFPLPELRRP